MIFKVANIALSLTNFVKAQEMPRYYNEDIKSVRMLEAKYRGWCFVSTVCNHYFNIVHFSIFCVFTNWVPKISLVESRIPAFLLNSPLFCWHASSFWPWGISWVGIGGQDCLEAGLQHEQKSQIVKVQRMFRN